MPQQDMLLNTTGLLSRRPEDARLIADINGRYFLKKWTGGNIKSAIYCRAQRITADSITFVGLAGGDRGDHAHVNIEHFGRLSGKIQRAIGTVLMMKIDLPDLERSKLAAKIQYFQRKKVYGLAEARRSARFKPVNPNSKMVFGDGTTVECYILDLSTTGAAVAASFIPEVGAVLAIGRVISRVVRHMDDGFAVQFVKPQSLETVEALIAHEEEVALL